MKIAFLLGDAAISGGTYVILQHALFLHRRGHDVTIFYLFYSCKAWHEAFKYLKLIDFSTYDGTEHFDIAIATWWKTVFNLEQVSAEKKCYFVQSIESFFIKDCQTELKKEIASTYLVNLPVITEARWIQTYLYDKYKTRALLVKNGIRKDYFYFDGMLTRKKRILVEGPVDVDFKNVPRTIYLCRKYTNFDLWLLTSSPISKFPGVSRVFSNIPASEVGKIYQECDFIVKLSYVEGMFGPPLEMFHCGGSAVVYNVTGHEEYMHNNENSIIIPEGDEKQLIIALQKLENDDGLLEKLRENALKTAALWPDWNTSSQKFEEALLVIPNVPLLFNNLYVAAFKKKNIFEKIISSKLAEKIRKKLSLCLLSPYVYPYLPNRGRRKKDT